MTIQRRVFWSNILMLAIPVLLSVLMAYLVLFAFTRGSADPMERAFPQVFDMVNRFQREEDLEQLYEQVDEFNGAFASEGVYMAVMDGDHFVYPHNAEELVESSAPLLTTAIESGATGSINVNDLRFVIERAGRYRLLLVDQRPQGPPLLRKPLMVHIPLLFLILIVVILVTNFSLTRLLTKRVTGPLDHLATGARQLGEGNLDYRIDYRGKDEFGPVCDDFNEMAAQLQKLIEYQTKNEESRKELLAGISHDLRTPLTSIKAYVEGLIDGVAEDLPAQLRYLSIIRSKAEDIDHIVDKLFLFSKLEIGDYPVNLETLDLGGELAAMARTAGEEYGEKGMTLRLLDPPQGVLIRTDPVCLHNVFVNLLENSVRYKARDTVAVTVRCEVGEERVRVLVSDDGPGVRDDELDKLFDVFYRGDPSRQNPSKGSGLGLAISARMMNCVGGDIRAAKAAEGGLCIELTFPRERAEGGEER